MKELILNAALKTIAGLVLIALLLFLPAGTFIYFGGLIFLGLLFIPLFIMGIILLIYNPKIVEKRLDCREKQRGQGFLVAVSGLIFVLGFISAGLDFRFGISNISSKIQTIASIVFLIGYALYFTVLFQNQYLSRIITVSENQRVIDTGLYSTIRHPMYAATILMFLSVPIILGSYISLLIFIFYPAIIIKRIKLEERLLERKLKGYKEYQKKVKYRLLPYIW